MKINSFKKLIKCSHISFNVFERHQKRSFLNRCAIAGANGPILLSVPLISGREQRTIVKEIRISNEEKWQLRHWRSIVSSYNSSPWFPYFKDEMADLYSQRFEFIIDWNLACADWLFQKFRLTPIISLSEPVNSKSGEFLKGRNASAEKEDGESMITPVIYRQVFQDKTGFIPNLSILDLLFCEGPVSTMALLQ